MPNLSRDGIRRQPITAGFDYPESPDRPDVAMRRYFDTPRPANDERRVYRNVPSAAAYDNICSTRFRYVDVSLPRVTMIDGPFAEAANDNASQEDYHAQEGYHAAA